MINFLKTLLMFFLFFAAIIYFYLTQNISTNISKSGEISRIYKNATSFSDKNTLDLISKFNKDGKITLSEYDVIVESYKSYSISSSLNQSISKAEQREREFMKRKHQTQENIASFALAN